MRFAQDPITGDPISPELHVLRERIHHKNAICGSCKAEAFPHGVGSLSIMAHFNHVPGSGPCELKAPQAIQDKSDYNGNGELLRSQFLQPDYIKLAFAACQSMVCGVFQGDSYVKGNFTVTRFKELIEIADKRSTWDLKDLTPLLMPFELVANEMFRIKYGEHTNKGALFTFALDKTPLINGTQRRLDRNISVDPAKPIHLVKYFMNEDGTFGGRVRNLDPENPYLVSEANAIRLAGTNWRRLPDHHVKAIIQEFAV